jgi:hypothetical protein
MTMTHIIAVVMATIAGLVLLRLGIEFHDFTVTFVENLEK